MMHFCMWVEPARKLPVQQLLEPSTFFLRRESKTTWETPTASGRRGRVCHVFEPRRMALRPKLGVVLPVNTGLYPLPCQGNLLDIAMTDLALSSLCLFSTFSSFEVLLSSELAVRGLYRCSFHRAQRSILAGSTKRKLY